MDVNLPSISELAQLPFLDPSVYQQGQRQVSLGNQFADQNLAMGAQDLQTKTLNNIFQQVNDPTKLQQNQANLQGTLSENLLKQVDAQQRETLAPEELASKRQKFVTSLSDDKLSQAVTDAQQMMLSDDPAIAEKGKDLYMRSSKEVSARAKANDELTKQNAQDASAERRSAGNNAATLGAAQISANGRVSAAMARKGTESSLQADLVKAKTPEAAANVYDAYAQTALANQDAEQANYYSGMRDYNRALAERARIINGDAARAANPDISKLTNGKVPAMGSQLPPMPVMPQRPASLGPAPSPTPVGPVSAAPPQRGNGGGPTNAAEQLMASAVSGPEFDPAQAALEIRDIKQSLAVGKLDPASRIALEAQGQRLQTQLARHIAETGQRPTAQAQAPAPVAAQAPAPAAQAPAIPQTAMRPGGRVGIVGPDGTKHTVPMEQLQQALKQGYKVQ